MAHMDTWKAVGGQWVNTRTGETQAPGTGPPVAATTLFGAFPGPNAIGSGESKAQMRARTCATFGVAQLPMERSYATVGVGGGSMPVTPPATGNFCFSFAYNNPSAMDSTYQTALANFVGALNPAEKYLMILNHEADQNQSGASQIAGFRIFADIVRANRANANVKTCTNLTSFTLRSSVPANDWEQWYPGDSYVDVIGFDSYWRPSGEFTNIDACFGRPLRAAQRHGKQLSIGETAIGAQGHGGYYADGVTPIPDSWYNTWLPQLTAYLTHADVHSVQWFNCVKTESSSGAYANWTFDCDGMNHPTSQAIYAAAVQNSVQYA